jgi:N-acetylmuramoyl-L-alanine amidase
MKTLKLAVLSLGLASTLTLGTSTLAQPNLQRAKWADVECLAKNIYHEARGEGLAGKVAVAQVTVNRVKSRQFQSTICGVVYAPSQFSWTLDKRKRVRDQRAWQASVEIARAVLTQTVRLPHFPALYFHTPQVNPRWNRDKTVVARIGNHIFYS